MTSKKLNKKNQIFFILVITLPCPYPHLLYAIPVWGSTYKTYLQKISTLQNKAVKNYNPH